jgi:hypothetical protein
MPQPKAKPLTPEQIAQAKRLRTTGDECHGGVLGWRKIARKLGVSEASLLLHFNLAALERKRAYGVKWREQNPRLSTAPIPESQIAVPPHVLEERDRALSIVPSITAAICGDPVFIRSALYRKQMMT